MWYLKFAVIFLLLSCSQVTPISNALSEVESIIEHYPDSALVLLNTIDCKTIQSKKLRAKYSLLSAIAFDKNHIDIQEDTIITPALIYYSRRGSFDERLKALYYRGIVERNRGNNEQAMIWYAKAERYADKAQDRAMAGKLYTAMMITYNKVFDLKSAAKMANMASKCYLEAHDTSRYISSALNMASILFQQEDTLAAKERLESLELYKCQMSSKQKLAYLLKEMLISNGLDGYSISDIYTFLSLENINYSDVDWLMVVGKYCDCADFDSASIAIENYQRYNTSYSALYYWYQAKINEHFCKFQEAAEAYRAYNVLADSTDLDIFKGDTKFIVERYKSELIETRHRLMLIIAALSICLITTVCLIIFKHFRKVQQEKIAEKIKMDKMYAEVLEEQSRLKRARKDTALGKNVRMQVDQRLSVLNKFILAHISGMSSKDAFEELSKLLEDRDYFLESTRISFIIAHPQFLMFLKQYNLSDWEIACCCMYCIGLNGSEISDYLNRKSYYNDSSVIRKKLGLDRQVNIDSFLRQKIRELDNKESKI